jgi:hypothetical protein
MIFRIASSVLASATRIALKRQSFSQTFGPRPTGVGFCRRRFGRSEDWISCRPQHGRPGGRRNLAIVALLHEAIEDREVSHQLIAATFATDVAELQSNYLEVP